MANMGAFRDAVTAWAAAGPGGPAQDLADQLFLHTAVLLEGPSDAAAVDAMAARHGRDLAADGVCVLPMGGAMSVGRFAGLLGPAGLDLRLVGLCDEREQDFYVRALRRADADPDGLFVCAADLEDELIRALGVSVVTELVAAEGESRRLQTFLRQPAQQGRAAQQQLRRFLGTKSGRKIHYGRILVEALEPARTPAPLEGLFAAL